MTTLQNMANELVETKKRIAKLTKTKKSIEESLEKYMVNRQTDHIDLGNIEIRLVAKIRKTVNWKSIFKKLKVSKKMISANTRETAYTQINLKERG